MSRAAKACGGVATKPTEPITRSPRRRIVPKKVRGASTLVAKPTLRTTRRRSTAGEDHRALDTHATFVSPAVLACQAANVDDIEEMRKSVHNRIRALSTVHGVPDFMPEMIELRALAKDLEQLEKRAVKMLESSMKRHPLAPFIAETRGLGLKAVARFLGTIGDLRVKDGGEPRRVSDVWSYCGLAVRPDGTAPRATRGQKLGYNPLARVRAYCIAEPMMKSKTSAYRWLYDETKARHALAEHNAPCHRCKKGKKGTEPAPIGSPLAPGHIHARAMRAVMKRIIKDLWLRSGDQSASDTQVDSMPRPQRPDTGE